MEQLSDLQRVVVAAWAALSVLVIWQGLATKAISALQSRRERAWQARQPMVNEEPEYAPPPP